MAKRRAAAQTKGAAPRRAPVSFDGKAVSTFVYDRNALSAAKTYRGPAVVAEYSATTVVPPGMKFQVDRAGNLVIETRGRGRRD